MTNMIMGLFSFSSFIFALVGFVMMYNDCIGSVLVLGALCYVDFVFSFGVMGVVVLLMMGLVNL